MLASYAPQQSVYESAMSTPLFKAQSTRRLRPAPLPSRSLSSAGFCGDDLRPHDLPPRTASPAGSFYSQSSSSSRSLDSASSSGSRRQPPTPPSLPSNWLTRSPRPPVLSIVTPSVADFASPPETPVEIPEAELRRRQLEKATRLLGESVPLELVFQPRHPLVKAFPDPPPRRSTESPQPGEPRPRATLTERRRPVKLARRASLSLSTFASKFRTGSRSTNHSRDSSQESASSDHSQRSPASANATFRTLPRRGSAALGSPIVFAFPRRSPTRAQTLPPSPPPPMTMPITPHIDSDPDLDLVLDIRSADPSAHDHDGSAYGHESDEPEAEAEATPVREHPRHLYSVSDVLPLPRPRIAPLPTHSPARSESHPARPETPFADYASARPETPFAEYLRPATPFTDLAAEEFSTSAGYLAPTSRKERGQGWSGEWNQPDMRDVIQRLRALR
ncbi:hypothetical protein DFH06DRAFT_1476232 [Mycena polygramma]|nr:hypothetical protein DFH06DRAFT_1476232 [Mycena polygramma]